MFSNAHLSAPRTLYVKFHNVCKCIRYYYVITEFGLFIHFLLQNRLHQHMFIQFYADTSNNMRLMNTICILKQSLSLINTVSHSMDKIREKKLHKLLTILFVHNVTLKKHECER